MTLDVRHLEVVRAIHDEGSLTRAARQLHVSQPALTRQLALLERRVGTPLFRRHARGMVLTPAGERLLESARRVLAEIGRAEHDVRRLAQGQVGTVRVSTECYMCYHWLPRVARAFGARFPSIDVELVPEATRDPLDALRTAATDLALVYTLPPEGSGIAHVPLFDDEIVGLVAATHPLAARSHLEPGDFRDETLLCHYAERGRGAVEAGFLEPAGVTPRRTLELLVTPAVLEMARASYGIAVAPRWLLEAQPLHGLVALPLGKAGLWRTWHAAHDAARAAEPALATMLGVLRDELRQREPSATARASMIRLA